MLSKRIGCNKYNDEKKCIDIPPVIEIIPIRK